MSLAVFECLQIQYLPLIRGKTVFFLISQENKHTAQTHVNDHSSLFYPCCFKCYVLNTFPASLVFHTSLFVVTPVLMDCL